MSVHALPHACRRSSGAVIVIVLDVRIDWHGKRPTNNKVKLRAVPSQAGGATTADQVHAAAVVGECANSRQRGRFA